MNEIDKQAFEYMTATADKTDVDLFSKPDRLGSKDVHNMLMAAGFTPAYGIIADAADAVMYAFEGEFGEAAWSAAAAIPVIGQYVASKRLLKAAEKSGEKMVTLFHGVDDWYKSRHAITHSKTGQRKIIDTGNRMVERGKFVGAGKWVESGGPKKAFWVSESKEHVKHYKRDSGVILEFHVPEKYYNWNFRGAEEGTKYGAGYFPVGLPKEFLKKVHK